MGRCMKKRTWVMWCVYVGKYIYIYIYIYIYYSKCIFER